MFNFLDPYTRQYTRHIQSLSIHNEAKRLSAEGKYLHAIKLMHKHNLAGIGEQYYLVAQANEKAAKFNEALCAFENASKYLLIDLKKMPTNMTDAEVIKANRLTACLAQVTKEQRRLEAELNKNNCSKQTLFKPVLKIKILAENDPASLALDAAFNFSGSNSLS